MSRHGWVLNRPSCSCRRVIDLLYFDGGAGKAEWVNKRQTEEKDASMKLGWQLPEGSVLLSRREVSLPSFTSEIVFLISPLLSFPFLFHFSLLVFLLSRSYFPFPFSLSLQSLHHLYSLTHLNPVFWLCCAPAESIKAVARSERPVLLSALSELQDPIKLLIRPFRRLEPPTALIIHPKIKTIHSSFPSIFLFCCLFLA